MADGALAIARRILAGPGGAAAAADSLRTAAEANPAAAADPRLWAAIVYLCTETGDTFGGDEARAMISRLRAPNDPADSALRQPALERTPGTPGEGSRRRTEEAQETADRVKSRVDDALTRMGQLREEARAFFADTPTVPDSGTHAAPRRVDGASARLIRQMRVLRARGRNIVVAAREEDDAEGKISDRFAEAAALSEDEDSEDDMEDEGSDDSTENHSISSDKDPDGDGAHEPGSMDGNDADEDDSSCHDEVSDNASETPFFSAPSFDAVLLKSQLLDTLGPCSSSEDFSDFVADSKYCGAKKSKLPFAKTEADRACSGMFAPSFFRSNPICCTVFAFDETDSDELHESDGATAGSEYVPATLNGVNPSTRSRQSDTAQRYRDRLFTPHPVAGRNRLLEDPFFPFGLDTGSRRAAEVSAPRGLGFFNDSAPVRHSRHSRPSPWGTSSENERAHAARERRVTAARADRSAHPMYRSSHARAGREIPNRSRSFMDSTESRPSQPVSRFFPPADPVLDAVHWSNRVHHEFDRRVGGAGPRTESVLATSGLSHLMSHGGVQPRSTSVRDTNPLSSLMPRGGRSRGRIVAPGLEGPDSTRDNRNAGSDRRTVRRRPRLRAYGLGLDSNDAGGRRVAEAVSDRALRDIDHRGPSPHDVTSRYFGIGDMDARQPGGWRGGYDGYDDDSSRGYSGGAGYSRHNFDWNGSGHRNSEASETSILGQRSTGSQARIANPPRPIEPIDVSAILEEPDDIEPIDIFSVVEAVANGNGYRATPCSSFCQRCNGSGAGPSSSEVNGTNTGTDATNSGRGGPSERAGSAGRATSQWRNVREASVENEGATALEGAELQVSTDDELDFEYGSNDTGLYPRFLSHVQSVMQGDSADDTDFLSVSSEYSDGDVDLDVDIDGAMINEMLDELSDMPDLLTDDDEEGDEAVPAVYVASLFDSSGGESGSDSSVSVVETTGAAAESVTAHIASSRSFDSELIARGRAAARALGSGTSSSTFRPSILPGPSLYSIEELLNRDYSGILEAETQNDVMFYGDRRTEDEMQRIAPAHVVEKKLQQMTCVICTEDLGREKVRQLPCDGGHMFHQKCIDRWTGQKATCPTCRADIKMPLGVGLGRRSRGAPSGGLEEGFRYGRTREDRFWEEMQRVGRH